MNKSIKRRRYSHPVGILEFFNLEIPGPIANVFLKKPASGQAFCRKSGLLSLIMP